MNFLTLKPKMSEKTYELAQSKDVYVFAVPKNANKHMVKLAVESQFKVTVMDVNVLVLKGKAKRTIMKRSRPIAGRQSDVKKAYVTLKKGDKIPVFAAIEEAEKASSKSEAKTKQTEEKK